ncbi:MAG TPA: NAD(+)/NADH kinase [Solirubrobacteraceae bacterium]|nr:NAD(+)/NADH kinase [Solirubrobacteraceae bacterium]
MSGDRAFTVLTHRRPEETSAAIDELAQAAERTGIELRFDEDETHKHSLTPREGFVLDAPMSDDVELCVVLGGDGTILRGLRRYARTEVPVFAVNFGRVGFLATLDPEQLAEGFRLACSREFEVMRLPAIECDGPGGSGLAINDVALHRKAGERVAELAYVLDGEEVGSVRCDGLVVATPAGSTGYNLANGGPVLAWGVEGFVVSFIAPHTLTARSLVAAPGSEIVVENRGLEPVEISLDGRPAGEIAPGEGVPARFLEAAAGLAQLPGTSFYRRLREKFGRLSR